MANRINSKTIAEKLREGANQAAQKVQTQASQRQYTQSQRAPIRDSAGSAGVTARPSRSGTYSADNRSFTNTQGYTLHRKENEPDNHWYSRTTLNQGASSRNKYAYNGMYDNQRKKNAIQPGESNVDYYNRLSQRLYKKTYNQIIQERKENGMYDDLRWGANGEDLTRGLSNHTNRYSQYGQYRSQVVDMALDKLRNNNTIFGSSSNKYNGQNISAYDDAGDERTKYGWHTYKWTDNLSNGSAVQTTEDMSEDPNALENVRQRKQFYQDNLNRINELDETIKNSRLLTEENRRAKEEKERLLRENAIYERGQKVYDDNYALTSNDDFDEKSSKRDYNNPTREDFEKDPYTKIPDKLGFFKAEAGTERNSALTYSSINPYGYNSVYDSMLIEGERKHWNLMTDTEEQQYYYILNTQGQESAYKFLDGLQEALDKRNLDVFDEHYASNETSALEKIGYNAMTVPGNVFGGVISGVTDIYDMTVNHAVNPYSNAHALSNYSNVIRTDTAQDINDAFDKKFGGHEIPGLGFSAGDAYQSIMSSADSALGAAILGEAYTYAMALGAFSNQAKTMYDQGASSMGQIAVEAFAYGAIEALTERYSVESLVSMKHTSSIKNLVVNSIKQAGIEASEEMVSEIADTAVDALIRGQFSDWQQMVGDNGYGGAFGQLGLNVLNAGIGGALSGGLSAGGTSAGGVAIDTIDNVSTGKELARRSLNSDIGKQYSNNINVKNEEFNKNLMEAIGQGDTYFNEAKEKGLANDKQIARAKETLESSKKPGIRDAYNLGKVAKNVETNIRDTATKKEISKFMDERGLDHTDKFVDDVYKFMNGEKAEALTSKEVKQVAKQIENDYTFSDKVRRTSRSERVRMFTDYTNKYVQDKFVNEDNKTTVRDTGEEVKVKGIDSIKNGKAMLKLDNGEIVNAEDLKYDSEANAVMYTVLADSQMDVSDANLIVQNYKAESGVKPLDYIFGMEQAYHYGSINMNQDHISEGTFYNRLTPVQQKYAYELGKNHTDTAIADINKNVKQKAEKAFAGKPQGSITLHNDLNYETMNDQQKYSYSVMDMLSKNVTFGNFHIYASKVVNGQRVVSDDIKTAANLKTNIAPNGFHVGGNGDIYVDINAGSNGQGLMLRTLGHELVHQLKEFSPDDYKNFADYVVKVWGEKGKDIDTLIKYRMDEQGLKYDDAFEEVVANSAEAMFTDTNLLEKLEELKKTDKNLWEKIKDIVSKFIDDIRSFYKDHSYETAESQLLQGMTEELDQLADYFAHGLVNVGEVRQAAMNKSETQEAKYGGISDTPYAVNDINADVGESSYMHLEEVVDGAKAIDSDGAVVENMFQYRAMENDIPEYRDMLAKHGMNTSDIDRLFNMVNKALDKVKANLDALDYDWELDIDDRSFEPVKNNSDPLYVKSVDFSTLCRKRILQQIVQVHLQTALDRAITREESIAIRNELMNIQNQGKQIEVACALCYVESARMKSPVQIQKFLDNRREVITNYFANKDTGSTKERKAKAVDDARKRLSEQYKDDIAAGIYPDPYEYTLNKKGNKSFIGLKKLPGFMAAEIRQAKRDANKAYQMTDEEQQMLNTADQMTTDDFTSPEGLSNLAKKNPRLFDAYVSYVRNATKSKGLEKDVWWRAGDSKSLTDEAIKSMNKENGLRSQSWSDFQVIHLLDYIAATIELSTRDVKMQVYTKVPDYVRLMGNTGQMINLSLIPTGSFNGTLEYDGIEGMPMDKALELRDKYPATAGTICIGIEDEQIRQLLDNDQIDYVIPYHHSGMSAVIRKAMHIPGWRSYQDFQSEKNLDGKAAQANAERFGAKLIDRADKKWHKHVDFSEWFDYKEAKKTADKFNSMKDSDLTAYGKKMKEKYGVMFGGYMAMQKMGRRYLKMTAERGLMPKFSMEKADFSKNDNYWKLLIDRKMINNKTGEIIEQKAIQPIFNEDDVLGILNDEVKRYEGVKADMDYATKTVVTKFLSGEMDSEINAIQKVTGAAQTAVNNVTKTSIMESETEVKLNEVKRSDRNIIYQGMSDKDRYDILVKKSINVIARTDNDKLTNLTKKYDTSNINTISDADRKKLLVKIGNEFGIFKQYYNGDVELLFSISRNNIKESEYKQKSGYESYIKMLSCIDDVIESAVGIEVHNRNNEGYKYDPTLNNVYVFVSAFEDGENVIPVKLEVKEFNDKENRLYVLATLEGINKDEVADKGNTNNSVTQLPRSSTISLSDLFRNINNSDESLIKYIPKQFFDNDLNDAGEVKLSTRGNAIDNRTLLANALESVAQNDTERDYIKRYKNKIKDIQKLEAQADELRKEYTALHRSGNFDQDRVTEIGNQIDAITNKVARIDKQLLKLESTQALNRVIEHEKAVAVNEMKEHVNFINSARVGRAMKTETRQRIKKLAQDLSTRELNPKKNKYVPKELVGAVGEVLGAINIDSGRSEKLSAKLADMQAKYQKLASDPKYNVVYDEYISEMIKNLYDKVSDKTIYEMSQAELDMVHNTLKGMLHTVRNAARVEGMDDARDIREVGNDLMKETKAIPKDKKNMFHKYVQMQLRPQAFFERLGGFKKNSTWSKVYQMLDKGQLRMFDIQYRANRIFDKSLNDAKYVDKLNNIKHLVDIGLKDASGNTAKITRGMMLSLYMHLESDFDQDGRTKLNDQNHIIGDNLRHIMNGGLTIPDMKLYYKGSVDAYNSGTKYDGVLAEGVGDINHRMSEIMDELKDDTIEPAVETRLKKEMEQLRFEKEQKTQGAYAYIESVFKQIKAQMTEQDYELIKAAKEFFNVFSKNELNKATMEMYGFEKANVENYFPIHTDKEFRQATFESISKNMSLENSGFMKDRVQASNPIMLEDISEVISNQIDQISRYCGMTQPVKDFGRMYSVRDYGYSESVQSIVGKKFGNSGKKYIENLLADLSGSRSGDSTFFDTARGNVAGSVLSLNLRVALAQAASFPTAAAEIGAKPLVKALGMGFKKADQELIAKYSPLLYYRSEGHNNTEIADVKNASKTQTKIAKKMNFLMGWISMIDEATVGRLWYASQFYVDDHMPAGIEKGTDAYYEEVARVFNNVVEKTQPNYSTLQRPDILRNTNAVVKQLTMFMTQRLQNMNIIYDSAERYMKYRSDKAHGLNDVTDEDVKLAKHTFYRSVFSQAIAAATIVGIKFGVDALLHSMNAYRDDDKELTEESVLAALADNMLDSLLSNVVGGSELYSAMKSYLFGDKYYGVSLNGIDAYMDTIDDIINLKQEPSLKNMNTLAKDVCNLIGIPLGNAEKIGQGFYNHYQDIKNGEFGSFEAGVSRKGYQDLNIAYNALMNGDEAKAQEFMNAAREYYDNPKSGVSSYLKDKYLDAIDNDPDEALRLKKFMEFTGVYENVDDQIRSWIKADKIKKGELLESKGYVDAAYNKFLSGDRNASKDFITDLIDSYGELDADRASSSQQMVTKVMKEQYYVAYDNKDNATMANIRKFMDSTGLYVKDISEITQNWIKTREANKKKNSK